MTTNKINNVIVVGGGLVGTLCAIFMAKRGYHVTVFEYREDIRCRKEVHGRSINMALSFRGRNALSYVGLEDLILESAIPMKGRLLHDLKGRTKSVPYDSRTGECIYSINRNYLNRILLATLDKYPNAKIYFNQKLISVNFDDETIAILNLKTQQIENHNADLIIGADGAYSTLRRFMQQTPLFEFSQSYIKHGYLELKIPPKNGGKMISNHLHIWPRGEFMMIALPNQDNSWTLTLFMPFYMFKILKNSDQLIEFFQNTFPDAINLIGKETLTDDFFRIKPSPLISVKCSPYHVDTKFLLIGDSAHAMVPFYGQGMNAGFEDCVIFDKILCTNKDNIIPSIQEFSQQRKEDAFAICELAMYNYVEMRDLVTKNSYHIRKNVDEILYKLFPHWWIPLYNSVTFTTMSYKKCIENKEWQDKVIQKVLWIILISVAIVIMFIFNKCFH